MSTNTSSRRPTSLSGSSRLSLSVVGSKSTSTPSSGNGVARHPLKQNWTISYVHRPPGAKNLEYEKEIRKVATFGSIESFLHLYAHLTPPSELPPVTDMLVFESRIKRPGVWEEMREGGRYTLRLLKPITPLLYESLLLSLIGDQFDESDGVVGCVLSVRQSEDILSVWVEEEGDAVRDGILKDKILSLLSLPSSTVCEYRSNKALLDAASSKPTLAISNPLESDSTQSSSMHQSHSHGHSHNPQHHSHNHNHHSSHNNNLHHNNAGLSQSQTHPIQSQSQNQLQSSSGRGYGYSRGGGGGGARNGVNGDSGGQQQYSAGRMGSGTGVGDEKDSTPRAQRGWGNLGGNPIGGDRSGSNGFGTRE